MPTEVMMPQMGESITEGTLTKWLKKPGDSVERDEPLFEISTDKVDAEIPSPAKGVLGALKIEEGATVQVNTVVCTIDEGGSGAAPAPAPAGQQAQPELKEDTATPAAEATAARDEAVEQGGKKPASASAQPETNGGEVGGGKGTEVLMPQMGESITEGTITKWLKNIGDTVARDEPVFEISTDKVDAEIPSPVAGKLTEIRVKEGSTVTINTVVAVIGGGAASGSAGAPASTPSASAQQAPAASETAQAGNGETPRSSPLVRKIASENQVDLQQLSGTGSAGRITKNDILSYLENPSAAKKPAGTQSGTQAAGQPTTPGIAAAAAAPQASPAQQAAQSLSQPAAGSVAVQASVSAVQSAAATTAPAKAAGGVQQLGEVVPMTKMRAIIAQRMVESKRTSPHVHTVFKVDMTRIVRLREKEKAKYEQRNGVKLTYMPFITRAAVVALRKHPVVNAAVQGDGILYNRNINIGIAVALDWGLIVPVIKQCEERNFLGVARSIVDLAERARTKKLAPDEVSGGTFTLTNSGIFGEQFGTPIINQPQVAILGIGGLNKEAVVLTDKDGQDSIAARSIQRFTLGFDHRIVDGADAGKFMTDFKSYLENWNEEIG